jgi:hypothetical protein
MHVDELCHTLYLCHDTTTGTVLATSGLNTHRSRTDAKELYVWEMDEANKAILARKW